MRLRRFRRDYVRSPWACSVFVCSVMPRLAWESPSFFREIRGRTVQVLRKLMGWQFVGGSVASLLVAAWFIPEVLREGTRASSVREVCFIAILPVMAAIFGIAWWTVWKERPSAKVWAVAASLISLLGSLWLISHSWRLARWCTWSGAATGAAGLVLFLWRDDKESPKESHEPS